MTTYKARFEKIHSGEFLERDIPKEIIDLNKSKKYSDMVESGVRLVEFLRDLTNGVYPSFYSLTNVRQAYSSDGGGMNLWVNSLINNWSGGIPFRHQLNIFAYRGLRAQLERLFSGKFSEALDFALRNLDFYCQEKNLSDLSDASLESFAKVNAQVVRAIAKSENLEKAFYLGSSDPNSGVLAYYLLSENRPIFTDNHTGFPLSPIAEITPDYRLMIE